MIGSGGFVVNRVASHLGKGGHRAVSSVLCGAVSEGNGLSVHSHGAFGNLGSKSLAECVGESFLLLYFNIGKLCVIYGEVRALSRSEISDADNFRNISPGGDKFRYPNPPACFLIPYVPFKPIIRIFFQSFSVPVNRQLRFIGSAGIASAFGSQIISCIVYIHSVYTKLITQRSSVCRYRNHRFAGVKIIGIADNIRSASLPVIGIADGSGIGNGTAGIGLIHGGQSGSCAMTAVIGAGLHQHIVRCLIVSVVVSQFGAIAQLADTAARRSFTSGGRTALGGMIADFGVPVIPFADTAVGGVVNRPLPAMCITLDGQHLA